MDKSMQGTNDDLNYLSAVLLKAAVEAGISSPDELANFMGNAHVETAGFTTMHERFNYSSAQRVIAAVSSADDRFSLQQIEDAVASRDPERIATILYEDRRKSLGNTEPGDGWRFHGRGYFQYTGRDNYTTFGGRFDVDLVANPDIAADPEMAARLAIAYWQHKVPEDQRTDVRAAARIINGGNNGMQPRISAAAEWKRILTPELIADVEQGRLSPMQYSGSTDGHLLNCPTNPHNALYRQSLTQIHAHETQHGITPGPHSQNLAAAITLEAIREGLHRIDRVEFNADGDLARAIQVSALRDEPWLNRMTQPIPTDTAIAQSLAATSEQARELDASRRLPSPHPPSLHPSAPQAAAPAL